MTTTLKSLTNPVLRRMFLPGLALLLLAGPYARSQNGVALAVSNLPAPTAAPAFQAVIVPLLEPLKLKVVFFNPAKEPLTLLIKNQQQEVIYRKFIGRVASFHTDFYLANVADGDYQVELAGNSVRYTKSVQIRTKVARLAQVL